MIGMTENTLLSGIGTAKAERNTRLSAILTNAARLDNSAYCLKEKIETVNDKLGIPPRIEDPTSAKKEVVERESMLYTLESSLDRLGNHIQAAIEYIDNINNDIL